MTGAITPEPLLLDDEEAVAFAVGLRAAASESIDGMEETSLRALAKLEQVLPDRLLLYTEDGEEAMDAVAERGLQPLSSLIRRSSLEDVFLRLTGRTLVD